jgi:uracil-DNA glycosylase family 4
MLGDIQVMPTYHPAYLLRNAHAKRAVWDDMQRIQGALGLR